MSEGIEKIKNVLDWAQRVQFLIALFLALGARLLLKHVFTIYFNLSSDLRGAVSWLLAALILYGLIELFKRFGTAVKTPPTPIARTSVSQKWLYTPLKQVYRTNFHDEEVRLDGHFFIDCSFGKNVTLIFDGLAPFKIEPFERTSDFKWAFKTDNLAIQHLLRFQMEAGQIVGAINNNPPPRAA